MEARPCMPIRIIPLCHVVSGKPPGGDRRRRVRRPSGRQHLRRAPVDVTLIDRRNFHLFQPLLYQVATGALSPGEIASPLRGVLKRAAERDAWCWPRSTGIDLDAGASCSRAGADGGVDGLRHADRRRGRAPLLLRPRRVGAARAGPEVAGGRARAAAAHPERLRGGRGRARPRAAARAGSPSWSWAAARPAWSWPGQIAEIARDTVRRDFRHIDPRTRPDRPARGRRPGAHRVPPEPLREGAARSSRSWA